MREQALAALVGSLLVATFVTIGTRQLLETYDEELLRASMDTGVLRMPVLTRTVGPGTVLTEADLDFQNVPAGYVAPEALRRVDEIVGMTVKERMLAGDLVRQERLADVGAGEGLAGIIPDDMRGLSIDMEEGDRVAGLVEPGTFVDLLVTLPLSHEGQKVTTTTLTAVRVLAVDERISETASGEPLRNTQVTLAVTPEDVQVVTHSLSVGVAKLALRADIDIHHMETHGVRSSQLLGRDDQRMSVSEFREAFDEEEVVQMVELIHGTSRRMVPAVDPRMLRSAHRSSPPRDR